MHGMCGAAHTARCCSHPSPPSEKLLKTFFGRTGDSFSKSMLSVYEDRVELDIKQYSFLMLCGLSCGFCEKEETYVALLRDIEYVKVGYIGSPVSFRQSADFSTRTIGTMWFTPQYNTATRLSLHTACLPCL